MSELIEIRREQAIREYECMKHLKLFTDDEIQDIKNKRHYHDYKVERRSKKLSDFINYIAYECNLFDLLLKRREKLCIKSEWVSLEKSIHNRIRVLYKRALVRFASEYRVWIHFLGYCKKRRFFIEGSKVLDQMLSFHGDKQKAWLCAINWEYHQAKNTVRAKHYSLRGLQRHPDSREICLTFMGNIFTEAHAAMNDSSSEGKEKIEDENETISKALKMARLVYDLFEGKDVDFYEQLLEVLKKCSPLSNLLAKEAIDEMRTNLSEQEEMWTLLANTALDGNDVLWDDKLVTFTQRLEKCVALYQEAIERLPTKKMHSLCIDTMLRISAIRGQTADEKAKRKALANAFKKAMLADLLEEEKMLQYLKLLLHNKTPNEELITSLIDKGLEQYPASVDVWCMQLRNLIRKEVDTKEIEMAFRRADNSLPDGVSRLPLWNTLFEYYQTRNDQSMDRLFRQAIDQGPEISHHYQLLFLDFVMESNQDIGKVRTEYQRLVKNYTTALELHQKMASLEASQTQPNVDEWRKCHENAAQFHGKDDPTVWLQYIQFERDHGKPKHVQSLYERAKAVLDEPSFATFMSEFEMNRNPCVVRY